MVDSREQISSAEAPEAARAAALRTRAPTPIEADIELTMEMGRSGSISRAILACLIVAEMPSDRHTQTTASCPSSKACSNARLNRPTLGAAVWANGLSGARSLSQNASGESSSGDR